MKSHFLESHAHGDPITIGSMAPRKPGRGASRSGFSNYRRVIQRDPCSYCGGRGGTVDHIIPKVLYSRESRTWFNVTGACSSCNSLKGQDDLLGFLLERAKAPLSQGLSQSAAGL